MSSRIECKDTVTFHPGHYIKEIVKETGLTQKEFAKRLGTTPKTLSKLLGGGQRLTADFAWKLPRMLGASEHYRLNLQSIFDAVQARAQLDGGLRNEKGILKALC